MVMTRKTRKTARALRSIPENEMEVEVEVSDDEQNLVKYAKPVCLYEILRIRFERNPYFLQKCLNYEIQAKKEKKEKKEKNKKKENKPKSGDRVIFNYMNRKRTILKSEVMENFSCPFCLMRLGDIKGLRCHLKSSHDFFDFEILEKEDKLVVDVTMSPDEFKFGELEKELEKKMRFNFCSNRRKQRLRDYFNNEKPHRIQILEMEEGESSHAAEMRLSNVNDANVSSPTKAHSSEKINQQEIAQVFESNYVHVLSKRKQLYAERKEAKRIENLKKRKFYHSQTYQPMSVEEVLADKDSEDEADEETADREEWMRLDRLKGVSEEEKRYMYLWNIFRRKQRVVADGHMSWACKEFTKLHKKELLSSSSFIKWWRVFMFILFKRILICPNTMNKCNSILRKSEAEAPSTTQGADNDNEQQNMEVDEEQH